ncbi:unnamed protein product [[Candida] boidinii]|uniref:Unnamed protein product n=1 Tax=Candida boidinii TaxID=5477 RepID=A0A9W6WFG1_CANBO|nr:hypothetical protein B5S30_g5453 [[Candida] boidinii]GME69287.1 unnamed protein product [[Candida] boidinii]
MELYSYLNPSESNVLSDDYTLRLVELNKDILKTIKESNSGKNKFYIKSTDDKSFPVLVTNNQTFKIRQKNHSNSVLLVDLNNVNNQKDTDNNKDNETGVGFMNFDNQLELSLITGEINISNIPILDNLSDIESTITDKSISLNDLFNNSIISKEEFDLKTSDLKLIEINSQVYILNDKLIIDGLYEIISILISEYLETKQDDTNSANNNVMDIFNDIKISYLLELYKLDKFDKSILNEKIIELIVKKFSEINCGEAEEGIDISYKLNNDKVVKFFGVYLLKLKNSLNFINEDEFLINLKNKLPFYYNPNLNLNLLNGNFIRNNLNFKDIQFFNKNLLNPNPILRFKELFKIKSNWELNEIEPFLIDINIKKLKIDKFIIKFARIKKIGKKSIVSSRN